jgi:phage-related protein
LTYVRSDIHSDFDAQPRKPVIWLHGRIHSPPFSEAARKEAGVLIGRLQSGRQVSMPASRPLGAIGRNCHELRIPDVDHHWRIVYAIRQNAVLILDVFSKKTQKTPWIVIESCRRRLTRYGP